MCKGGELAESAMLLSVPERVSVGKSAAMDWRDSVMPSS